MKELPPSTEIYSDIYKFVRDYAAVHDKRRPQNLYSGIRGAFENLLQLTRNFDDAGQEGRISCGEVCVFPGIKPPQKGVYGAQTDWGAKIPRLREKSWKLLSARRKKLTQNFLTRYEKFFSGGAGMKIIWKLKPL